MARKHGTIKLLSNDHIYRQPQFQFVCKKCGFKSKKYRDTSGKKLIKKLHMKKCEYTVKHK